MRPVIITGFLILAHLWLSYAWDGKTVNDLHSEYNRIFLVRISHRRGRRYADVTRVDILVPDDQADLAQPRTS